MAVNFLTLRSAVANSMAVQSMSYSTLMGSTITSNAISCTSMNVIPYGSIIMWYGSVASIPAGWALCNGSNNTPDLRGRFVVGAGDSYSPGNTGGANTVTLTAAQMPSHSHSTYCWDAENVGNQLNRYGNGTYFGAQLYRREQDQNGAAEDWNALYDALTGIAGSDSSHENRPPYYALCYIMRTN